jgi:hypothetical protein
MGDGPVQAALSSSSHSTAFTGTIAGSVVANARIGPWISHSYNRSSSRDEVGLPQSVGRDSRLRRLRFESTTYFESERLESQLATAGPSPSSLFDLRPVGIDPSFERSQRLVEGSAEVG